MPYKPISHFTFTLILTGRFESLKRRYPENFTDILSFFATGSLRSHRDRVLEIRPRTRRLPARELQEHS